MGTIRDRLSHFTRKGVKTMDDKRTKGLRGFRLTPPRLTSKDLRARGKASVTLTTDELQRVANLLRAGMVMTNDLRSVSKNLRAAMTKMGVDTKGL
jgi:hypothetical protein